MLAVPTLSPWGAERTRQVQFQVHVTTLFVKRVVPLPCQYLIPGLSALRVVSGSTWDNDRPAAGDPPKGRSRVGRVLFSVFLMEGDPMVLRGEEQDTDA